MPPGRWQCFVDDVGLFLDRPFSGTAAALGWGPHDLFGCDRAGRSPGSIRLGSCWRLNGDTVALSENTATIATPTGGRQTYRRKLSEPDRVLAWSWRRDDGDAADLSIER